MLPVPLAVSENTSLEVAQAVPTLFAFPALPNAQMASLKLQAVLLRVISVVPHAKRHVGKGTSDQENAKGPATTAASNAKPVAVMGMF